MKKCAKCRMLKDFSCFSKSKHQRDGFYPYCKQCERERQLENKEKYKNTRKKYRIRKSDYLKKKNSDYANSHKSEKSEYDKIYRAKNAEKIKGYKYNWEKRQRLENPQFRIKNNLRRRIIHALNGETKSDHTFNLIGCAPDTLKIYLEKKFYGGMSWENYGSVWHVDHLLPCSSFDLTNPEEQRKCFHYSNLQPLLKEHNLKKGRKIYEKVNSFF